MNEIIKILGLEEKLQNLPSNLSGGEQQRVAITRALVTHNNEILELLTGLYVLKMVKL